MRLKQLIILLALFILAGCSGYQKVLKSNDSELKYDKAMEFYNDGDYYKALQLLDDLVATTRGTDKAEDVYYYYAYAHYKNEEYILASYYFKNFVKNFPKSDKREECLYMSAYCKYLQAPEYYLDQTTTKKALDALELFKNKFPKSEYNKQVNNLINDLKDRIEKKAFHKALLYYNMEDWKAAAYALKVFVDKYPVSEYREEALFKILDAKYNFALNSIKDKKTPRYQEAIQAYENLISEYPDSEFKKQADKLRKKAENALTELKSTANK